MNYAMCPEYLLGEINKIYPTNASQPAPTPDPYQHKVENACQMLYKTLSEFDEEISRIEQQLKVIRQARLILHKNVSDILSESSKVKVVL